MFHENTMLQSELRNMRARVKAMQDTIDALSAKNIQLLAEKATGAWLNSRMYNYKITPYIIFCFKINVF